MAKQNGGRELTKDQLAEIYRQAEMLANRKIVPGVGYEDLVQEFAYAGMNSGRKWGLTGSRPFGTFVRADMEFHYGHLMAAANRDVRKTNHRSKKFGSLLEIDSANTNITSSRNEWDYVSSPFNNLPSQESQEILDQRAKNLKKYGKAYSDDEMDRIPGYEGDTGLCSYDEPDADYTSGALILEDGTLVTTQAGSSLPDFEVDLKTDTKNKDIISIGLNAEELRVVRYIAVNGIGHTNPKKKAAADLGIEASRLSMIIKGLRGNQVFYAALTGKDILDV